MEVVDRDEKLVGAVKDEADARGNEILAHLAGSPGSLIIDYPDKQRLFPHAFQEGTIQERVHGRKFLQLNVDGNPCLKWLDADIPPERVEEIARELGLDE